MNSALTTAAVIVALLISYNLGRRRRRRPYMFAAGRIPARVAQPQPQQVVGKPIGPPNRVTREGEQPAPAPEPTSYLTFAVALREHERKLYLFSGRRAA